MINPEKRNNFCLEDKFIFTENISFKKKEQMYQLFAL